jgi:amidase
LLKKYGTTELYPWLEKSIEAAKPYSSVEEFTKLLEEVDSFRSSMLDFMKDYDVIICPVSAFAAPLHGSMISQNISSVVTSRGYNYTGIFNITGWPAAVVRAGTSPEGLPIGVQIVGRSWREDVVLAVAQQLEKALGGWQRPPI